MLQFPDPVIKIREVFTNLRAAGVAIGIDLAGTYVKANIQNAKPELLTGNGGRLVGARNFTVRLLHQEMAGHVGGC